jgi:hypothetical protein
MIERIVLQPCDRHLAKSSGHDEKRRSIQGKQDGQVEWIMQKHPNLLSNTTELVVLDVVEVKCVHQVLEWMVSEWTKKKGSCFCD